LRLDPRYLDDETWDPVSAMAGVSEAAIFVVTLIAILWSRCNRSRAEPESPEDGTQKVPVVTSVPTVAQTKTSWPRE
jgi:hypothetical protein